MKYYLLTNSIQIQEVGRFPQCIEYVKYIDFSKLPKKGKIESFPILPEFLMQNKARPTTFITTPLGNSPFFVVKQYFIKFLSNFGIDDYQFWNVNVYHKTDIFKDYQLFYIPISREMETVDYESSKFYIRKIKYRKHKGKSIAVKNRDNYLNTYHVLYDDGYWLKCNELIFNLSGAGEDLFRLTDIPFGHGYYVSERLKTAIEKERFTGMAFKEIEEYNKKIKVIY